MSFVQLALTVHEAVLLVNGRSSTIDSDPGSNIYLVRLVLLWRLHSLSTCESDFLLPVERILVIKSMPNSFPLVLFEIRKNNTCLT